MELMTDPPNNEYLLNPQGTISRILKKGSAPILIWDAKPVTEEYFDSDDESDSQIGGSRSLDDLSGHKGTPHLQIIPRTLPYYPPTLLARRPGERMNIDMLRLFKINTKFLYTRSMSFRTNLLEIFKR
jgi:hypothetical protein